MEPLMTLNGVNGQIYLFSDKVVIKRKGLTAKLTQGFTKGDKSIYLKQISGIQIKKAGILFNGYIQFTLAGGNENTKGIVDATHDENTIIFNKKNNNFIDEFKKKIEELQQVQSQPINNISVADEIKKYKDLLDQGILTQEEFDKKKKQLLDI